MMTRASHLFFRLFGVVFVNVVQLEPGGCEEGTLMLGWKRRFALAAWVGLLPLVGCGGGNQSTPFKASDGFSPASIAVTGSDENVTGRPLTGGAICSGDGWCWRNPLPQGNPLFGVWGSGANDVWAVGGPGTILHWDGFDWMSVSSGTTSFLSGVWGSGASDVWAVGGYPTSTILHWDGSAWTSVPSGTEQYLNGVWGSG